MSIVKAIRSSRISTLALCLSAAVFAGSAGADSKTSAEPMLLAAVSEGFNAEQTYRASCAACHNSGAAGAPKLDDPEEWATRLEKGMDAVVANAINGLNGVMPPKGLCFNCTDDDLRAVVEYMVTTAQGN